MEFMEEESDPPLQSRGKSRESGALMTAAANRLRLFLFIYLSDLSLLFPRRDEACSPSLMETLSHQDIRA